MKAKYLRKGDKRWDVKAAAGDKLKHYNVTQGACSDGCYIYMAFEQKPKHGREHRIKIVKVNPATKKVEKVSKAMSLGHANDMCIFNGELLITHSGSKKVIHRVKISSFTKLKDISIDVPKKYRKYITGFNGIAKTEDGFVLRGLGGNQVLYLDEKFKVKKVVKFTKPFEKRDSQGMDYHKGIVYRSYSRLQSASKNYICKFKPDGKLISKSQVKSKGELESVFIHQGKIYGTMYRKKKKDGKKHYMAYIFEGK